MKPLFIFVDDYVDNTNNFSAADSDSWKKDDGGPKRTDGDSDNTEEDDSTNTEDSDSQNSDDDSDVSTEKSDSAGSDTGAENDDSHVDDNPDAANDDSEIEHDDPDACDEDPDADDGSLLKRESPVSGGPSSNCAENALVAGYGDRDLDSRATSSGSEFGEGLMATEVAGSEVVDPSVIRRVDERREVATDSLNSGVILAEAKASPPLDAVALTSDMERMGSSSQLFDTAAPFFKSDAFGERSSAFGVSDVMDDSVGNKIRAGFSGRMRDAEEAFDAVDTAGLGWVSDSCFKTLIEMLSTRCSEGVHSPELSECCEGGKLRRGAFLVWWEKNGFGERVSLGKTEAAMKLTARGDKASTPDFASCVDTPPPVALHSEGSIAACMSRGTRKEEKLAKGGEGSDTSEIGRTFSRGNDDIVTVQVEAVADDAGSGTSAMAFQASTSDQDQPLAGSNEVIPRLRASASSPKASSRHLLPSSFPFLSTSTRASQGTACVQRIDRPEEVFDRVDGTGQGWLQEDQFQALLQALGTKYSEEDHKPKLLSFCRRGRLDRDAFVAWYDQCLLDASADDVASKTANEITDVTVIQSSSGGGLASLVKSHAAGWKCGPCLASTSGTPSVCLSCDLEAPDRERLEKTSTDKGDGSAGERPSLGHSKSPTTFAPTLEAHRASEEVDSVSGGSTGLSVQGGEALSCTTRAPNDKLKQHENEGQQSKIQVAKSSLRHSSIPTPSGSNPFTFGLSIPTSGAEGASSRSNLGVDPALSHARGEVCEPVVSRGEEASIAGEAVDAKVSDEIERGQVGGTSSRHGADRSGVTRGPLRIMNLPPEGGRRHSPGSFTGGSGMVVEGRKVEAAVHPASSVSVASSACGKKSLPVSRIVPPKAGRSYTERTSRGNTPTKDAPPSCSSGAPSGWKKGEERRRPFNGSSLS